MSQVYAIEVHNLYIIRGNSAILKCELPSFVSDFTEVVGWIVDGPGGGTGEREEYVGGSGAGAGGVSQG